MPASRLLRAALIVAPVLASSLVLGAPKGNRKHPTPAAGSAAPAAPAEPTPAPAADAGSAAAADAAKSDAPKTAAAATEGSAAPAALGPDVDSLRQEYLSLRDELFKSRARANAVASTLYSTRVTIRFTWASARYYGVTKSSIRLDGATIYEDATGAIAGDDGVRFDGYVAPGRHVVTFHVDATGKDDDSFTSSTEAQVVVKAVANKDLIVAGKGKDTGDIAYAWKKQEHGTYALGIDVGVKTVPHGTADAGGKATKK
jgi:hypothetical protein